MKWLILIGTYLIGLLKGLSTFFLSGGGVVFLAVGFFTGFVTAVVNLFIDNSSTVAQWLDKLADVIVEFQTIDVSGLSGVVVYATAVDSLLTYLSSFTAVLLSLLTLVCFGVLASALAIAVPLAIFKVVFFLKKQITSVS